MKTPNESAQKTLQEEKRNAVRKRVEKMLSTKSARLTATTPTNSTLIFKSAVALGSQRPEQNEPWTGHFRQHQIGR